jgi:diamine N-acetyltransferase
MQKISARRLEASDLPLRVDWFNHPAVRSQIMLESPISLASTQRWLNDNLLNDRRIDFAFEQSQPQRVDVVCMTGLVSIDYKHRRAELYIVVAPTLTGQGIGSQALRWTCNYAFGELALNRIYLYTLNDNVRARAFYERHGFRCEGVMRQHSLHQGVFVDRYIHGLLRQEWEELSWASCCP